MKYKIQILKSSCPPNSSFSKWQYSCPGIGWNRNQFWVATFWIWISDKENFLEKSWVPWKILLVDAVLPKCSRCFLLLKNVPLAWFPFPIKIFFCHLEGSYIGLELLSISQDIIIYSEKIWVNSGFTLYQYLQYQT